MIIYLWVNANDEVEGWGSHRSTDGEIEVDIPETHPFFNDPFNYKLTDGVLVSNYILKLQRAKEDKDKELNSACNKAILAGFSYVIDDITYWFSYDMEAQGNFRDARTILQDGLVTTIPWTVRVGGVTGEYDRIPIDLETINQISVIIVQHKTSNIARYRDLLMPVVTSATTVEEVNAVVW